MKAFHQAPVVSHAFPSCQKPCVSFSRRPYDQSSHQYQHVAAKVDTFVYNKKYRRLMVTVSSLSGTPYEKYHQSAYNLCKDSSLESLNIMQAAEQKVLPQDIDAQFIESILFDRTLYKYEILGRMASTGLMSACDEDEIVFALNKIEQDIAQGMFEWIDDQDVHTNVMKALINIVGEKAKVLTTMNRTDLCLSIIMAWYKECIALITSRIKQIQVALMLLAIRNEGLVLPGAPETEGNTSLHSITLSIVKELAHDANYLGYYHDLITSSSDFGFPVTDSYFVRSRIGHTADRINYDVPKHLMQMVNMFVSLRNLPCFIPNDKVVTCYTFLEKFRPNERLTDGFFALDNCLNTSISRSTHGSDIEDAKFYLFSGVDNVLDMLDWCIKITEGISVNQKSSPRDPSNAVGFAQFLKSKGLSLETSYAVVSLCLKKRCQPGELIPQELQRIGFPCDSLEEIHEACSQLLGKQIVFNCLADRDSLAELLFWFGNLEIDPHVLC